MLARYLAVAGHPDDAARDLRRLARDERLDLGPALDLFEERTGFIAARGVDLAGIRFAADFVRTLDYYTGFIFEIREATPTSPSYRAAGGRYDGLLAHLGAVGPAPAVGCSFWLDRTEPGGAP